MFPDPLSTIKNWTHIRLFERQYAALILLELQIQLESQAPQESHRPYHSLSPALGSDHPAQQLHEAEVDYNYTLHFPLNKHYINRYSSMRGKFKYESGTGLVPIKRNIRPLQRQQRSRYWLIVEKCMAEHTLEELRMGRLDEMGEVVQVVTDEGRQLSREVEMATDKGVQQKLVFRPKHGEALKYLPGELSLDLVEGS
jgi:hypothetical protein